MSIKINDVGEGKLSIEMDNGHVQALEKIVRDYDLIGNEDALGFVLSVISQANGSPISINGNALIPSENIKKKKV
ncbi:MAG: hypothetical protein WC457_02930 [Patescibacteria group bacterium]